MEMENKQPPMERVMEMDPRKDSRMEKGRRRIRRTPLEILRIPQPVHRKERVLRDQGIGGGEEEAEAAEVDSGEPTPGHFQLLELPLPRLNTLGMLETSIREEVLILHHPEMDHVGRVEEGDINRVNALQPQALDSRETGTRDGQREPRPGTQDVLPHAPNGLGTGKEINRVERDNPVLPLPPSRQRSEFEIDKSSPQEDQDLQSRVLEPGSHRETGRPIECGSFVSGWTVGDGITGFWMSGG
jgi:hypothetical protein